MLRVSPLAAPLAAALLASPLAACRDFTGPRGRAQLKPIEGTFALHEVDGGALPVTVQMSLGPGGDFLVRSGEAEFSAGARSARRGGWCCP